MKNKELDEENFMNEISLAKSELLELKVKEYTQVIDSLFMLSLKFQHKLENFDIDSNDKDAAKLRRMYSEIVSLIEML